MPSTISTISSTARLRLDLLILLRTVPAMIQGRARSRRPAIGNRGAEPPSRSSVPVTNPPLRLKYRHESAFTADLALKLDTLPDRPAST